MKPASEQKLEKMLNQLELWQMGLIENGATQHEALIASHKQLEKEYGTEHYKQFNIWLEKDNPGPFG